MSPQSIYTRLARVTERAVLEYRLQQIKDSPERKSLDLLKRRLVRPSFTLRGTITVVLREIGPTVTSKLTAVRLTARLPVDPHRTDRIDVAEMITALLERE